MDSRQITYVNVGASLTRVRISVRDGVNASTPRMLTFSAVVLDLRLVRNAPLAVVHGGAQLVRPDNLLAEHNLPRLRPIDEDERGDEDSGNGLSGPGIGSDGGGLTGAAPVEGDSRPSTDIVYELLRGPALGELQVMRDERAELWTRTRSFTQHMIDTGLVRADPLLI